jgi:hypothetical protein
MYMPRPFQALTSGQLRHMMIANDEDDENIGKFLSFAGRE